MAERERLAGGLHAVGKQSASTVKIITETAICVKFPGKNFPAMPQAVLRTVFIVFTSCFDSFKSGYDFSACSVCLHWPMARADAACIANPRISEIGYAFGAVCGREMR